jgi:hypothetical protein
MKMSVHNVRDLTSEQHSVAEQLVGHALCENQRIVIQVLDGDIAVQPPATSTGKLPEWCNVYAGLSDEEIAKLEESILARGK